MDDRCLGCGGTESTCCCEAYEAYVAITKPPEPEAPKQIDEYYRCENKHCELEWIGRCPYCPSCGFHRFTTTRVES